jgi:uncharacterized membrane protein
MLTTAPRFALLRHALRLVLVAFFGTAGVMHLVDPGFFHAQLPTFLPAADMLIRGFGVLFLVGAAGLLGPRSVRRVAALELMVLLVVVWPGNWWGALQPGSYVSPGGPEVIDWLRVPFQFVLVALVAWANHDVLDGPVVVEATTTLTPTQVVEALTDFGPHRTARCTTLDPARLAVHARGEGWAEVTEGARPPGPVERERYDWSEPGLVTIETLTSTAFRPGSWWRYEVTGTPRGSRVRLLTLRRPASALGRVVHVIGWFAGRRILGLGLRRALATSEEMIAAGAGPAAARSPG